MNTTTVAVDLAKDVYQQAVADSDWRVVQTARLSRSQFVAWFQNHAVNRVIMRNKGSRKVRNKGSHTIRGHVLT